MKIQPTSLPPEKARKELKQFAILGILFAVVGLAVMWFLGILGLAFGARALMLSYAKGLDGKKELIGYRALAIGAVVVGIFDILGGIALNS